MVGAGENTDTARRRDVLKYAGSGIASPLIVSGKVLAEADRVGDVTLAEVGLKFNIDIPTSERIDYPISYSDKRSEYFINEGTIFIGEHSPKELSEYVQTGNYLIKSVEGYLPPNSRIGGQETKQIPIEVGNQNSVAQYLPIKQPVSTPEAHITFQNNDVLVKGRGKIDSKIRPDTEDILNLGEQQISLEVQRRSEISPDKIETNDKSTQSEREQPIPTELVTHTAKVQLHVRNRGELVCKEVKNNE